MHTHTAQRRSLWVSLVGMVIVASLAPQGVAQSPTTQPLVQAGNMRYLGSFRLPSNDGSGASTGDLTFGGTALGISPNGGLLVGGHDWTQRLCEVAIPAIGGLATIRQRCIDVTEGRMSQVDDGTIKLGGSFVYNGRLITSAYSYYDADGNQAKSHFASGLTLATTGDLTGPVQLADGAAGFVSGQMASIPAEWQSLLGGPALAGHCCISIISRSSLGPSVSVFNPDNVGRVSPVPATRVVGYPMDHPLANPDTANGLYMHTDVMGGFAFPAGTRSVLFFGRHGSGSQCYGEAAECSDPAEQYKGYHSYPYNHQVWAYDANDLVAVKNGTRQPWEVRPYAVWRLPEMNNNGSATIAGATYDPATRRVYITEAYSYNPLVHVYEVTVGNTETAPPPSPPPPPEACGDGIDNDLDGLIDEGCTVPNPPPPPTPEICGDGADNDHDGLIDEGCTAPNPPPTTPPPPEVCGDGVDNDHDGQIDEGCPKPPSPNNPPEVCADGVDNDLDGQIDEGCPGSPQRLSGDVQSNRDVRLSWLAPITGAAPTEYIVEAGVNPGQTTYTLSSTQTSARVQNVGTGKYYIRVRAKNALGLSAPSNEITASVGCSSSPNPLTNVLMRVRGGLVTMTWTDPDGCAETTYRLRVHNRSGRWLAGWTTSSEDVTALAGPGEYFVTAQAVSSLGESEPTSPTRLVVSSAACTTPQFATQLSSQVTGSVVQLAWNPTNIAEALSADAVVPLIYVLEVGTGPGLSDVLRAPIGRMTSLMTPAPSGTYYVRVRPADVCGLGTMSNEVIVRVP